MCAREVDLLVPSSYKPCLTDSCTSCAYISRLGVAVCGAPARVTMEVAAACDDTVVPSTPGTVGVFSGMVGLQV